jgi:hypothetical protein
MTHIFLTCITVSLEETMTVHNNEATVRLRGYHTLQGDNSLKSVERFDHMMHHAATNFYSTARTLP